MPRIRLTRVYRFSAAHRLHAAGLSAEQNRVVYGKCNNPHGHGHDYTVELSVSGEIVAATGRVVSVEELDRRVHEAIIEPFDRRDLNTEVAEFAPLVPTTENLAAVLAARLAAAKIQFEKLRVWETPRNIFQVSA